LSLYFDASLLVTLFTREPQRPAVREWLDSVRDSELVASEWVATEVSSAFALKVRVGAITPSERATAQSLFRALWSEALTIVPMRDSQFQLAAGFCGTDGVVVRAGDALHLAIAKEHSLTVCTRDGGMAAAATALGLQVVLVAAAVE
jgi:predicted nucleic acid-binding protein